MTEMSNPNVPPLPSTLSELKRKTATKRTLNDAVEFCFSNMYDADATFRALLNATYNSQAVEGDIRDDDTCAAQMIREYAKQREIAEVVNEKLATLRLSLNVVLKRWNISRKERREALGGVTISPNARHTPRSGDAIWN